MICSVPLLELETNPDISYDYMYFELSKNLYSFRIKSDLPYYSIVKRKSTFYHSYEDVCESLPSEKDVLYDIKDLCVLEWQSKVIFNKQDSMILSIDVNKFEDILNIKRCFFIENFILECIYDNYTKNYPIIMVKDSCKSFIYSYMNKGKKEYTAYFNYRIAGELA